MLAPHPGGTIIDVWVVPGASRDEIVGEHDGALKVRVSAPPEGGKANTAVARLFAGLLPGHHARVVSGATSRRKQVLIEGATPEAVTIALTR